jgi:hypothetical protein
LAFAGDFCERTRAHFAIDGLFSQKVGILRRQSLAYTGFLFRRSQRPYLNLDGGFDSTSNRKAIFNAGMIPNITENPRNRKRPKRGRKRLFNQAIHALRDRVERTFAWEDKFKRLLLRFEHLQRRHYGMKLMAYTLINVRRFCAT